MRSSSTPSRNLGAPNTITPLKVVPSPTNKPSGYTLTSPNQPSPMAKSAGFGKPVAKQDASPAVASKSVAARSMLSPAIKAGTPKAESVSPLMVTATDSPGVMGNSVPDAHVAASPIHSALLKKKPQVTPMNQATPMNLASPSSGDVGMKFTCV